MQIMITWLLQGNKQLAHAVNYLYVSLNKPDKLSWYIALVDLNLSSCKHLWIAARSEPDAQSLTATPKDREKNTELLWLLHNNQFKLEQ